MLGNKIKSILAGSAAAIILAVAPNMASAQSDNGNSNAGNKVTICHATGSQTNPYVQISPNANGVINGHVGHQGGRDIIPPFDYNDHGTTKHFAGQGDQSILANGCVVATVTTPPTTTPPNPANQPTNQQVLGATTGGGQDGGQVSVVPEGSVDGGYGGASAFSLTTLNRAW